MSAEWQFLIALNEQMRPLRDPVQAQEVAMRLLSDHLGHCRVNYTVIDGDEFIIARSFGSDGVAAFGDRGSVAMFGETLPDASRRGETVVVTDIASDPRLPDADLDLFRASHTAAFVGAPLIKDGRWVAVLGVQSAVPRQWTSDQVHLIEITAERLWVSAERARAEEALGRSESRQKFLRRLNDTVRPLADPARILQETCRLLAMHLGVSRVSYGEIDGDDYVVVGEHTDGVVRLPGRFPWAALGGSQLTDILRGGTLIVNDTSAAPHTAEESAGLRAADIGAYLCPLLVKDGRFVASFGIHSRAPRIWTADEIALAEEVADRIWTTLEYRRAETGLRANEERLAFLLRLNDALRPLSDPAAVQETAARLLAEQLGVTRVGYAEIGDRDYVIRHEHTRGVAPLAGTGPGISTGDTIRDALRRGETAVVADVETDPRLGEAERATFRDRQIAAFIGVALFKDGAMVAAFGANHVTPRAWTAFEVDLVRDVAARTWDAVERTRAESALREHDKRLRLALEASAGGSWSWDAETNQVHWDERFRALYGFAADEPAHTDKWLPRVHEDDRPRMLATMQEMMTSATKTSWENTFRVLRPDGTVTWVQSRGRADRDAAGKILRLTGLDLDFDRHRRLEEAEQARRDREHDHALSRLLETATQGIVSVDDHGRIMTANHAFEAMFGWLPGELIGQTVWRLMPQAFVDRHAPQGGRELVGVRKDASTFPIDVTVNYVPGPTGGRAFAFVTDITERQRAAAALRARTIELEQRTVQLRQMASDVTLAEQHAREQIAKTLHDGLQQLLVIASSNLDRQLKRDRESGAPPSELLAVARRHLDEAIAAARSLSIELFPPILQRAGLPAALKWLAGWVQEKYKIEVEIALDPRADSTRKDVRTLLFESARELLFNAVKHAQADRVMLELTVDADDNLCISVSDPGVGFDPDALDDRSKTGQGWGLFSIRERLTLLGGRFDLQSVPGYGTRVSLVAPRISTLVTETAVAVEAIAAVDANPDGHASTQALRILVVDDHSAMRTTLRDMLHERPQLAVVGDAANGYEAIASARMLRPDVIVMDVAMPNMDGIEATARIHAEMPEIEILGLSMHSHGEVGHAIEQAGAAGFFVKGTDSQRLIDHLLHVHASRQAGERTPS